MCYVESTHSVKAYLANDGGTSSIGVCQVKLATARRFGFVGTEAQLSQPQQNIYYAGRYLKAQLTRYHGDVHKAIAAYNAGSHRVNDQGITKNRAYVRKVAAAWSQGK